MSRLLSLAAGSVLLLALAAPASADPNYTTRSQIVHHGDLDLDDPADADVMIGRIHRAARNVCAEGGLRTLSDIRNEAGCRSDAQANGVRDTNSPTVIARYHGYDPRIVVSENEYVDPYPPYK